MRSNRIPEKAVIYLMCNHTLWPTVHWIKISRWGLHHNLEPHRANSEPRVSCGGSREWQTSCLFIQVVIRPDRSELTLGSLGEKRAHRSVQMFTSAGKRCPADQLNRGLSSNSHCENGCWDSFQIEISSARIYRRMDAWSEHSCYFYLWQSYRNIP